MFDREGKIKLNPFSAHEITAPTMKSKLSLFNDFTSGDTSEETDKSKGELFAQDIFDLGYILLICAIGGIDIINPEVLNLKEKGDTWWLLHFWEKTEVKLNNISVMDMLNDRYSSSFSDFLWKLLKFDYKERESIKNLVSKDPHPWLSQRSADKPKGDLNISLKELLNISGGWTEYKQWSTYYLDEFKQKQVDKLLDLIEWVDYTPTTLDKSKIYEVAQELLIE